MKSIRNLLIAILMLPFLTTVSLATSNDVHLTPAEEAFIEKHPEV